MPEDDEIYETRASEEAMRKYEEFAANATAYVEALMRGAKLPPDLLCQQSKYQFSDSHLPRIEVNPLDMPMFLGILDALKVETTPYLTALELKYGIPVWESALVPLGEVRLLRKDGITILPIYKPEEEE